MTAPSTGDKRALLAEYAQRETASQKDSVRVNDERLQKAVYTRLYFHVTALLFVLA